MLDKDVTRAGFGPRAAAYIIDRLILLAGLGVLRAPFLIAALFGAHQLTAKSFLFDHSLLDVLCWLGASAYFVLLTYFTGGTLGKKVMRLRVEKEDGSALGLVDAIYRETVGRFLSGILCVGYLMALVDKKKRGFHDWLCDTRVVYEEVSFRVREKKTAETEDAAPVAYGYSLPGAAELPTPAETAPAPAEAAAYERRTDIPDAAPEEEA